ncbi:MAG: mandelate racemase/muconate lactonizing enzyme family protein [bacterium]|nr:mandelate racemase/muconate lactonizing enzyme family protein [bacterium]
MSVLKIRALEAKGLQIPLERPIASALGTYTHVDCVATFLHTEGGPTGYGLTMGLGGSAGKAIVPYIEHELAPLALGQDALAPEALWQRLWGPNKARMRGGLGLYSLSAVDIACWDVVAKVANLPLHTLVGGFKKEVPVYGSGGWHTLSDGELVAECEMFAAKGIGAYKMKIGSTRDEERVALIRENMGDDFILYTDANQKYSVREAVEVSAMLADYGVAWLEEPVLADTLDDLAEVAEKSHVPIGAGENAYMRWGFREICERRAAAYLQPDICRCGGITEFIKIIHLADAYCLSLCSHLVHELSISIVGASPAGGTAEYVELFPEGTLTNEFKVVNGCIRVPDVPGHGVEFTAEAFKRFAG